MEIEAWVGIVGEALLVDGAVCELHALTDRSIPNRNNIQTGIDALI
jgi:hypothetical protein